VHPSDGSEREAWLCLCRACTFDDDVIVEALVVSRFGWMGGSWVVLKGAQASKNTRRKSGTKIPVHARAHARSVSDRPVNRSIRDGARGVRFGSREDLPPKAGNFQPR
jgi:hypothetical protein